MGIHKLKKLQSNNPKTPKLAFNTYKLYNIKTDKSGAY